MIQSYHESIDGISFVEIRQHDSWYLF